MRSKNIRMGKTEREKMKNIIAITACTILLIQGGVFAHEGEKHPEGHMEDVQMTKLHAIMPMYAQAQLRINAALGKGDASTVGSETGKILSTLPDLKKSEPHKNLKQIKTMRKLVSAFEGDVKATAALAKKGNWAGAKVAFAKAQKRCDECHAKFRD